MRQGPSLPSFCQASRPHNFHTSRLVGLVTAVCRVCTGTMRERAAYMLPVYGSHPVTYLAVSWCGEVPSSKPGEQDTCPLTTCIQLHRRVNGGCRAKDRRITARARTSASSALRGTCSLKIGLLVLRKPCSPKLMMAFAALLTGKDLKANHEGLRLVVHGFAEVPIILSWSVLELREGWQSQMCADKRRG